MILYLDLEVLADHVNNAGFKVRDYGLLEAALARARTNLYGIDVYPTIELKAAAIVHSIIKGQPLVAANNRAAWFILNSFLTMNGILLKAGHDQVLGVMHKIQTDKISLNHVADWISTHTAPFA